MRLRRGIRATAWALVAVGVAAPALRRRISLPRGAVLASATLAPAALPVVMRRSARRDLALCGLNMWAYLAAYEMPHDEPDRLAGRARIDYPIAIDRTLGMGMTPTLRLQRAFAAPGSINRFERVLVWCHWMWFFVPHASLAYVWMRAPKRFASAAVQMYAVFDLGAGFYWTIPTAPPWWATAQGRFGGSETVRVRRMMIEYGESFWGERWGALYDVLGGNPLAAMPSLHFATSLMGAHLLSEVDPVAGAVAWSYALTLGLALVYLGEHYLVDLLAGAALTEAVRGSRTAAGPRLRAIAGALHRLGAWAGQE